MKVVIAPDSFKGSLSAASAAHHLALGVRRVFPEAVVVLLPVADGGEGTVQALVAAGGRLEEAVVTGPLGEAVTAQYGVLADGTGVIEMAAASGLVLVPLDRRDPLRTSTRGTGELVSKLLDQGCRRLVLGLGGSATNDGGVGLAQALGWSFLDAQGRELGAGGGALSALDRIEGVGRDPRLAECQIVAICDVTNPLVGPLGASAVYGPQKGADAKRVSVLDANLTRLADVAERDLGVRLHELPGGGAAGGLGAGLAAFCGAVLRPGIDSVLDVVGFDAVVADADLVLTGEGRLDGQTAFGKVPVGVAARSTAGGRKVPVVAFAGSLGPGAEAVLGLGIDAVVPLADGPLTLEQSMDRTGELLEAAAERALRLVRIGGRLSPPAPAR